ncbi:MAG: hypothetical protein ABIH23_19445, partial [bacterium]
YTFDKGRIDWKGQEFLATFKLDKNGDYVLKSWRTPKRNTHLNFFSAGLKGGVGHLIPKGQTSEKEASSPERKVSPSK